MTGVTILNSYVVNGVSYALLFLGIALIMFICSIREFIRNGYIAGSILVILSVFMTGLSVISFKAPEKVLYEVIISDDVGLKEFRERYEIVDQRGDIFIVEEREKK